MKVSIRKFTLTQNIYALYMVGKRRWKMEDMWENQSGKNYFHFSFSQQTLEVITGANLEFQERQ
jgi:hypothetical protein